MPKFIHDWSSHHILLTGAQGGLGQAIAQLLTDKGAKLTLVGRNQVALEQQAEKLHQRTLCLDLLDADALPQLLAYSAAQKAAGLPLTAVIHNAGDNQVGEFTSLEWATHARIMQLNTIVPMAITHALLPELQQQSQSFIGFVGSGFGAIGFPGQASYCASKAALARFSEALQRELEATSTQLFYIAPRAIETPMNNGRMAQLNQQLGNKVDHPEQVALAFINQIEQGQSRQTIGWPEKFFSKLNALFPALVDSAMKKPRAVVRQLTQEH
ncbi:SDR family oxidoreductase [Pseudidiomarina taiwanensis]|uniref:Short chain dehydrogenase n=1 Tax=Pseudidiomarina taiwanensis TaxID=337250 RepID=A0A432ZFN5_9GAMM|nr:SDR family oxidoreductase [Pseudidiomarina taiwanensis]RUO76753.1 short chain dehydrogenase [Pseudidiomarina taiwanensis]